MTTKGKYILFYAFVFALCIPALQNIFHFIEEKPLQGAYLYSKKPELTKENWFNGSFQENLNQVVEEHIGFRASFIRLRNQFEYFLFGKINASNVVAGKDDVLFQDFYIESYLGKDFLGEEVISQKVERLSFVMQELKKRNVQLIFLIAPGKASVYKEYLPEWVENEKKGPTNYDVSVRKLKEHNVPFLDMKQYFLQIKDTVPYPLFPKSGTHWSGYSITLVTDTLRKYIEQNFNIKLNSFKSLPGITTGRSEAMRFTDNDIGSAMNLIFELPLWEVYYPEVIFKKDSTAKKPNMLSIGDSFTQSFFGFYPFFSEMFDENSRYWYYNRVISWPDSIGSKYISVESLNLKKEVEQRDIILIVSTEQNLSRFGYGFLENVAELYDSSAVFEHKERVARFIQKIKNDPEEVANLQIKSKTYRTHLDKVLHKEAEKLAQLEEDKIAYYETQIKSSPEWLESVRKKALEKNITLNKMIRLDAIWMVENEQ